ncbi:hypothetical protein KJ766_03725 [Patescibacteria group bacterium]|nr:hypothetical protein [Patescibacteria group bacterium]
MHLRREKQGIKETWALVVIGFAVLVVFAIWGLQLAVTFSSGDIDLAKSWQDTQGQIKESVQYAEDIEGSIEGRTENIEEYLVDVKKTFTDEFDQAQLQQMAAMILAGTVSNEEADATQDEKDSDVQDVMPVLNEDGWIIVDEVKIDEE